MARLLVLWDIDFTLIDAAAAGRRLYEITFAEMFGGPAPRAASMAGRTDRAIALEVLRLAGVTQPHAQVGAWEARMAANAPAIASLVRERGRVLPGALEAITAIAALAAIERGASRGRVVQSVLTGNLRALAEVKLGALGLAGRLDLAVGAYGDVSETRADLVQVARRNAAARYGTGSGGGARARAASDGGAGAGAGRAESGSAECDGAAGGFGGAATVLVGDTPHDIGAALATGARAVGVATGSFTAGQLASAGAHAVLPDLRDTSAVLTAILGPGDSPLPARADVHDPGGSPANGPENSPRS